MPLKIYYLDDEADLLEMFCDLFANSDFEIKTFVDPQTAIDAIQSEAPDLLFIDYRLTRHTGDEIAQKLDPKIKKALVTGDVQANTVYKFDAVFEKPFKLEKIEEYLEGLLSLKKAA